MNSFFLYSFGIILSLTALCTSVFLIILVYIIIAHIIRQLNMVKKSIGLLSGAVHLFSGEFVLNYMHNGGSSVVIRALVSGTFISIFVILAHYVVYWDIVFPLEIIRHNGWQFCGIYAAAYAAFYARFVSQWTYLSNLYNQIKITELTLSPNSNKDKLYAWMSGFIEDAESLHLETKPMFATVISIWLEKYPEVGENYCQYNPKTILNKEDGHQKLEQLKEKIRKGAKK